MAPPTIVLYLKAGGPRGPTLEIEVGDTMLIPPGVAHKQLKASADFALLGSYPQGEF